jgi:hypothetical protein
MPNPPLSRTKKVRDYAPAGDPAQAAFNREVAAALNAILDFLGENMAIAAALNSGRKPQR